MARPSRARVRSEVERRRRAREEADEPSGLEGVTEEERRQAAEERFTAPMISHLWHPDGTPFTDEEYVERGIEPPPPGEQPTLVIRG